jgi:RNA polymerase sigma factor (sigma-70 family)
LIAAAPQRKEGEDLSDDDMMRRIAARDHASFRLLIDRNSPAVHRIAYRMLANAPEAEDVTQDAMLRLWSHAERWQAGSSGVAAWLNRVAVNLCFDKLRRRKFSSDAAVPEREDETPRADALIDSERLRAATIASIQALPDRQRAAIILTYYEDQSNIMAAGALDMNIKAFESLLLRARQALRKSMLASGLIDEGGGL